MAGAAWKTSSEPDEKRVFGHGTVEFFGIGGGAVRRFTLRPGWRWSLDMGPAAKSEWCEASHFQYQVSGRMHVQMEDGAEFDLGPGDISLLPAGHDTWVIGDEPVVLVDWYRASHLTTPHEAVALGSDKVLPRSERWFQALLSGALDLITVVDAKGKILYSAPSTERVVGWKPIDVEGHLIGDFVHPDDALALGAAFARALEHTAAEAKFEEIRFRTPDGSYRRIEVVGNNRLADPAVHAVVVSGRDVTQKREDEERLRRSEKKLRDLVQNMPVLVFAVSADLVPLAWNKECERVTGWSAAEILRRRDGIAHLVPDAAEREDLIRRVRTVGRDFRAFETRLTAKDGSIKTIVWSSLAGRAPIPGWQMWAIGRDVTAEKHALRVVIEASRLAATNTLAGGVARNINDLMKVVAEQAATLLASATGPKARGALGEIGKAADAAARLAEQLLAYSRGATTQPGPVNLNDAVRRAVAAEGEPGTRNGISIALDLEPALAPTQADASHIDHLVGYLLTNAKEAITGRGSIVIRTRNVAPSPEEAEAQHLSANGSVRLSIRDSGCGMTAETAARAFEPFYSTKLAGRGLGLAAAFGIVTSHLGKIGVESRVGDGSTFTVDLPALVVKPGANS